MTSEITQAFAHPEARSAATADPAMPDRISLRDHIVEAEIGAFQQERGRTQRICFNIVVEVSTPDSPVDDDVDRILSYDHLTEAIAAALAAERLNLLETLAERIAERVLVEPRARRIFVRIEKLDRGPGALGVEIVRARRPSARAVPEGEAIPHPTVVFLSNAAIAAPGLAETIDGFAASGEPLIFCVGLPAAPAPAAEARLAQRRIDLLALEQNAWVLAGRDRRCVVVSTRTELDWAMRHGQICVWAPSKLVLDAVEGPRTDPRDAPALAAWFAETMEARELVLVGAAAVAAGVPVRVAEGA
ncbi:dihydroneopterin aldolase [Psychromarinibacter sp. C21-152]|uniref:dihydroneopterin aldolase n=1 Tax=Psychromarinibacter sediminicola TaxID=3033385 RepID=A0AAE3NN49_9RHOB|nr:dihydroneopterin aldolase [Psychromarinibacter sediminicola]MDF0601008.1 dihydroneopterin aldolase [Psychromarinibacter sediminicola]